MAGCIALWVSRLPHVQPHLKSSCGIDWNERWRPTGALINTTKLGSALACDVDGRQTLQFKPRRWQMVCRSLSVKLKDTVKAPKRRRVLEAGDSASQMRSGWRCSCCSLSLDASNLFHTGEAVKTESGRKTPSDFGAVYTDPRFHWNRKFLKPYSKKTKQKKKIYTKS